jgi:hypothetical protein
MNEIRSGQRHWPIQFYSAKPGNLLPAVCCDFKRVQTSRPRSRFPWLRSLLSMPPRRRSSINPATVSLPVQPSPSKIPRRKSALAPPSPSKPIRRRSSVPAPKEKITPRNSLADGEDLPKETPYAAVFASITINGS